MWSSSDSDDDFVDASDQFPALQLESTENADLTEENNLNPKQNEDISNGSLNLTSLINDQASPNSPSKQEPSPVKIVVGGSMEEDSNINKEEDDDDKPIDQDANSTKSQPPDVVPTQELHTVNDESKISVSSSDKASTPCSLNASEEAQAVPCIKRPTNLPIYSKTATSSAVLPSPIRSDKPKRPPPPKPSKIPKRPPQPFFKKHMFNDGKQTPNTTVNNITKDFAAFTTCNEETIKNSTSTPLKSGANEDCVRKDQVKQSPNKSNSLKRTSTSSNKNIDEEILSTVIVRNLDTGQTMPLSTAAEQVSQYLNPLSLQIMSRTKEFNCPSNQTRQNTPSKHDSISLASDELPSLEKGESSSSNSTGNKITGKKLRIKSQKIKGFLNNQAKKAKNISKSQFDKVLQKAKQSKMLAAQDETTRSELNVSSDDDNSELKYKVSSSLKGQHQFNKLRLVQDINVHVGAVWSMKFSHCGRLLATAGQNNIIWVWVLKDYYQYFSNFQNDYQKSNDQGVFATPPRSMSESSSQPENQESSADSTLEDDSPFRPLPLTSYVGHTSDVLDLAWSKNYFTLSSSMDKTCRLWHISQKECLCCFQHIDFVTAIAFHPKDDRYFLSGSLDSKLRLWNIPEKKVALWNEVGHDSGSNDSRESIITSVAFCENGKYACCGTYDGRCLFYSTEQMKYYTQIHVRGSRKNRGFKITGVEPLPSEHKVLITSNDSRIRLYDLRDLTLSCKYKGYVNTGSQIKATFSHDHKYIIAGSEDKSFYIWPTHLPQDHVQKMTSLRRDRNIMWESVRASDTEVVTCAIFAPFPHLITSGSSNQKKEKHVIISADFVGVIKVFMTS